ncbi:MAG: cytochrome c family protein [Sphingobium sp.]
MIKFSLLSIGCAILSAFATTPAFAGGDAAKGQAVFARCASCHNVTSGAKKLGPDLGQLWGQKAGTKANFSFSPALKNYGKVWNEKTLDVFLAAPMKEVPGTRMAFVGVSNANDRANLIAYLKQATK